MAVHWLGRGPGHLSRMTKGTLFSPVTLFTGGTSGAWIDISDRSTLFQDTAGTSPVTAVGQSVARVNDKSGNGNNLLQATAAFRPTYQLDSNGLPYLLFDGVDDYMQATLALAQPMERLAALCNLVWTINRAVLGMDGGNNFQFQGVSPNMRFGTATSGVNSSELPLNTNGVVSAHFQGASSWAQINNNPVKNGDSGATTSATAFAVGSFVGGTQGANMRYYGEILRVGTMTAAQFAASKTYLGAKCGILL